VGRSGPLKEPRWAFCKCERAAANNHRRLAPTGGRRRPLIHAPARPAVAHFEVGDSPVSHWDGFVMPLKALVWCRGGPIGLLRRAKASRPTHARAVGTT
jgi:hypothetical protein